MIDEKNGGWMGDWSQMTKSGTLGESKLFTACEGDFHICYSPHYSLLSPDAEGEPQLPSRHRVCTGHHHLGPLHSFRFS